VAALPHKKPIESEATKFLENDLLLVLAGLLIMHSLGLGDRPSFLHIELHF
jgi:hypothetical protein